MIALNAVECQGADGNKNARAEGPCGENGKADSLISEQARAARRRLARAPDQSEIEEEAY
jgi:hypothetical protein